MMQKRKNSTTYTHSGHELSGGEGVDGAAPVLWSIVITPCWSLVAAGGARVGGAVLTPWMTEEHEARMYRGFVVQSKEETHASM